MNSEVAALDPETDEMIFGGVRDRLPAGVFGRAQGIKKQPQSQQLAPFGQGAPHPLWGTIE